VAGPEIERRGLTLVGIAIANLDNGDAMQLTLPFAESSADAVDSAIDAVRDRFGTAAITRGVLLGRDGGFEMPHLPD
jgi:DNA polymerase-4